VKGFVDELHVSRNPLTGWFPYRTITINNDHSIFVNAMFIGSAVIVEHHMDITRFIPSGLLARK